MEWSESLELGVPMIDADHQESIALANAARDADDSRFAERFEAFAEHLREHFERENALMEQHAFFAAHCHQEEHDRVLAEVDDMLARLRRGSPADARAYVRDGFPVWFQTHHATMDFVTANHILSQVG